MPNGCYMYSATFPAGKLFKPTPDADRLAALAKDGWVDTPTKIGQPAARPARDEDEADVVRPRPRPPGAPANPPNNAAGPIDIRKSVPVSEAVDTVNQLTDVAVLKSIRAREAGRSNPKGGRKALLVAIDARVKALKKHEE